MAKVIEGNILDINKGVVCQQVNCKGVMGIGLALDIRKKYPIVYDEYESFCRSEKNLFGRVLPVRISDDLVVCNIFSQLDYSKTKKCTNEATLIHCLLRVLDHYPDEDVYIPYKIGCGYGGGSWDYISKSLECVPLFIVKREEDV